VIDRARFLGVIADGMLTHQSMDSTEIRTMVYGDPAVVTARTKAKGKFIDEAFSTDERATSVYSLIDGDWKCVLTQLTPIAPNEPNADPKPKSVVG
jgi:hypothetical protein